MSRLLNSKGFMARLKGGVFLLVLMLPSYLLFGGILYRIFMAIGFVLALIELFTTTIESRFFPATKDFVTIGTICISILLSIIAIMHYSIYVTGGIIIVTAATDVFAYLGGNLIGGKITKSKPFPNISPKKTWEGCAFGLVFGLIAAVIWYGSVFENPSKMTLWLYVWIPLFAVFGDVLESYFKRRAGVKDSNEYVVDVPVLKQIEGLLGGANGHGGYLDRLDALSFVMALFFVTDCLMFPI